MKKILAVILVLALTLSLFGCGSSKSKSSDKPDDVGTHHYALAIKAIEITEQYLDSELSTEDAYDKIHELIESTGSEEEIKKLDVDEETVYGESYEQNEMEFKDLLISVTIFAIDATLALEINYGENAYDDVVGMQDTLKKTLTPGVKQFESTAPNTDVASDTTSETAPAQTNTPTTDKADADNSTTSGQKNALQAAINYISVMAFSYDGLIEQLEYEKYSHEDAQYGADHCGANWNDQAVKSAKNYLSTSAFSYDGLIDQLEFEKYTTEQATYGADHCGADWMEQAVKAAKQYLDVMSFSRDELIDQLEFEGFTYEQAVHGVEGAGY